VESGWENKAGAKNRKTQKKDFLVFCKKNQPTADGWSRGEEITEDGVGFAVLKTEGEGEEAVWQFTSVAVQKKENRKGCRKYKLRKER